MKNLPRCPFRALPLGESSTSLRSAQTDSTGNQAARSSGDCIQIFDTGEFMHTQDNVFFEEYKRLDRLCGDMYRRQNGVSAYIADMEENAAAGQFRILNWNDDYKMLKHVRWIRTKIAHEPDNNRFSEAADTAFLQDFHNRVLSQRDPLAALRKVKEEKRVSQQSQQKTQNRIPQEPLSNTAARQTRRRLSRLTYGLIVLAIVLFLTSYFVFFRGM